MTAHPLAVMCRRTAIEWVRHDAHFADNHDPGRDYWPPAAWSAETVVTDPDGSRRWAVGAIVTWPAPRWHSDEPKKRYLAKLMINPHRMLHTTGSAKVCIGPDIIQEHRGWDDHMQARRAAETAITGGAIDGLVCWRDGRPKQPYPVEAIWQIARRHFFEPRQKLDTAGPAPSALFPGDTLGPPVISDAQAERWAGVR